MAAIPLVIITLDLDVVPLVVSTIMKGKPFQFSVSVTRLPASRAYPLKTPRVVGAKSCNRRMDS
eukprot:COSAG05_NODE_808_length_7189_cov_16.336530_7_plen_64_part_00